MYSRRYGKILPLCLALGFLSLSCTDPKVYRCNEIISIANRAVNQARELTDGGQTNDPQAMIQAADAMEESAEQMRAIQVEDEQLQDYQTGFITMYDDTANATRRFVKAYEESNRDAAESALQDLQQATSSEQELVQGINDYCSQI